jgi:hypothetical protein
MQWLQNFFQYVKEHKFWGLVTAAFIIVVTLGAYLRSIDRIQQALSQLVSAAVTIDPSTRAISVKESYAWVAVCALVAVLVLALFIWQKVLKGNQAARDLAAMISVPQERRRVMEKTFEKMMQAASQIAAQLYPENRPPLKNLVRARRTYLISENFDTAVTREDDYKALTDLHVERILLAAEQDADPCDFLDDLNFKVRDAQGPDRVAYLPTKNAEFEKEVAIFFLPHIQPEEPAPRRIIVSYKWPRMMHQLQTRGFEIGDWTLKSRDNIPDAELRVFFPPRLRRQLKASIHGRHMTGESLEEAVCDTPGCGDWEGWSYKLVNAPPGTYQIKFQMSSMTSPRP